MYNSGREALGVHRWLVIMFRLDRIYKRINNMSKELRSLVQSIIDLTKRCSEVFQDALFPFLCGPGILLLSLLSLHADLTNLIHSP